MAVVMADPGRKHTPLPSINYLDLEKIKREGSAYNQKFPLSTALNMPAPLIISPVPMYSGPPPPYSYPSSTASTVVGGYISPAESRRTSDDDKEQPPAHRQSLPSIQEALGNEQSLQYTPAPSKTTASPQILHPISAHTPTTPTSRPHLDTTRRGPTNPFSQVQQIAPYLPHKPPERHSQSQDHPQSQHHPHAHNELGPSRFSAVDTHEPQFPSLQPSKTAPSPTNPVRPSSHAIQHQTSSVTYDRIPHSTPSMNPQYAYSACQPSYSFAPQPSGIPASQPPIPQHPTWRSDAAEIDRAEEVRKVTLKESPPSGHAFGESVKRHLDIFDLETSLNEIAEGSGRALDFSRLYGIRAHQTQRSGLSSGSMPSLIECEEMIRQQSRVLDSMVRIREVIISQQQALAEQRNQDQNYKGSSEIDDDGISYQDKLDGSGGFAGSDPKKRRGRAAPPGRCHSCNRAETPEWRRGPDGARTLCNACGLHYAKLTRKMGSKSSLGGSNLRPKEMGPGSPQ
ncbi:hypothetical protein MMC12_004485 [Toensbergia leucococca]|nr:hypothetical protein [Toensbergia leucococca]